MHDILNYHILRNRQRAISWIGRVETCENRGIEEALHDVLCG